MGVAVAGTYGTLTLNADGSYTYTLNNADGDRCSSCAAGQPVTDTFSYTMADDAAATSSANLMVTITGTNDAPVADADAAAVQEDVSLAAAGDVLANDTDVDAGDTQTVTPVNGAAGNVGAAWPAPTARYPQRRTAATPTRSNNAEAIVQQLRAGQPVDRHLQLHDGRRARAATVSANLIVTITGTNDAAGGGRR